MRLLSLAVPLPPLDIFPGRVKSNAKRGASVLCQRALRLIDPKLTALAFGTLLLSAGGAWVASSSLGGAGLSRPAPVLEAPAPIVTPDPAATAAAESALGRAGRGLGLIVNNVMVEGRNRTAGSDILMALNVERGAAILDVDMQTAREAVEALPWVRSATVSRRLPDTVHVQIEERTPIALWQRDDGAFMLTDATGAAIPVQDVGTWGHLPVITGAGAPQEAAALFSLLNSEPALAPRVKAATRRGDRRWDILLDDFEHGVTVKLPEHNADAAWHRMAALEGQHRMLENDVAEIDLRMIDRVVIRLNGDGIPVGDLRKGGPKLKALPLPPGGGREA